MKDNETTGSPSGEKIPVAMIGLGPLAGHMLGALARCPAVRVVGIADRDAQRAQLLGRDIDAPHYTDNRQLLMGTRPAAVFLATPPMAAVEIMETCASLGIHVWKDAPLGRNLGEAASMVRRFTDAGLKLAVGTQRRFVETYQRAHELRARLGQTFLGRAEYFFNWGSELGWRADAHSAGGGALLELGYHPIDLLVWMLGLPEEVYGLSTRAEPSGDALAETGRACGPHDTDDTASALLRYKYDAIATVSVSRISGPVSEMLALRGQDGSLVASGESCTLRNPNGDVLDHIQPEVRAQDIAARQVESFIDAVASEADSCQCSAMENLMTHAVIEAIYLSSQTCQPESPLRQLEIHGLRPADNHNQAPRFHTR